MRGWLTLGVAMAALLGVSASDAAELASPKVQVDRIEIVGVTSVDSADVEGAIEVSLGEILDRKKVVRSAQNLQEVYRAKGFERLKVVSELLKLKGDDGAPETVLRFTVTEGKPTRIVEVKIRPESTPDERFLKYWKQSEKQILARIGISKGSLLEQEKLANARRVIQDIFSSEEYLGARVVEEKIIEVPAPAGSTDAEARWVELHLQISLGDRVSFGFRGNHYFAYSKLTSLVEEQRVIGFGKDYIGAIKVKIEDEYRNAGFTRVKVTPYTFERPVQQERHISYFIEEGDRFVIEMLDFDGNLVFTKDQLRDQFYARAALLIQEGYYTEKEVDHSATLLVEWLKSQGYLSAKLVTINRVANPKFPNRMWLTIYLYEGERTVVQSIRMSGVTDLTPGEVKRTLGIDEGAPLNLFAFSEGIEAMKTHYRARGYLDFKIANEGNDTVIAYAQENRMADIFIDVVEGPLYRVSKIEIEGLTKTLESVVRRELRIGVDDVVEQNKIADTEDRLRKLGIFSLVTLRTLPDSQAPGKRILRISLQEGTPGLVAGGLGFRNDLGARVFAGTSYSNLWRRNHTVSFNVALNRRFDEEFCSNARPGQPYIASGNCFVEGSAALGYRWPWFASIPEVTFRPRITVERVQFRKFDSDSISLLPAWERNIVPSPNLTGVLTYSLERIKQYHAQDVLDNGQFTIGALIPSIYLDMRDNPLAPTKGLFTSASYEIADRLFGSQSEPIPVGYTRAQFRSDFFYSFTPELMVYFSFRTGLERNTQPPPVGTADPKKYSIPVSKQFVLGGAGSLRGFKEQELNAGDVPILGTLSYVNYRLQIDLPFAGALRFGPFLDAANLLVDRYSLGQLRYGTGVGFRYRSPVGPVNFDWGYKVDPRPGEDTSQFYFSIGVI